MIKDFNIRDNDWDLLYSHYSTLVDTIWEVANSFHLKLSIPINLVPIQYINNS